MDSNKEKYYNVTKNSSPHLNVINFLNLNVPPQKAIDLGCGTGRDTIDWNVLSIDREDTESIIKHQLTNKELKNFRFKKCLFGKMKLPKVNLIVANFSLPFSKKEFFSNIWENITNSILHERVFCWKFFWKKRYMG